MARTRSDRIEEKRMKLPANLTVAVLLTLTAGLARAESPGDRVIRKMDEAMTQAEDQRFLYDVKTQEPGKKARMLEMDIRIKQYKGKNWRRVDFLGPGDVKGMKVLSLSLGQMYVYLPAYRKVRRVAGHVRDQGFMGTTYSHDEISIVEYGPEFTGKLLSETKNEWKVEGRRRPKSTFRYPKVVFAIRKDVLQATEIRYYGDKGNLIKSEVREDYTCKTVGGKKICQPRKMKLTDHTRNGAWTSFTCKSWEINTGINDRFFTVRALQRGR
jgi:outer membrane lipoprotein-sorting protein